MREAECSDTSTDADFRPGRYCTGLRCWQEPGGAGPHRAAWRRPGITTRVERRSVNCDARCGAERKNERCTQRDARVLIVGIPRDLGPGCASGILIDGLSVRTVYVRRQAFREKITGSYSDFNFSAAGDRFTLVAHACEYDRRRGQVLQHARRPWRRRPTIRDWQRG